MNGGSQTSNDFLGYRIYKAATFADEFELISGADPITDDTWAYSGSGADPNAVYMVRAVVLETTPSGTYYNASQGVFSQNL